MEINKENYEAFLLDLWEGTLSEDGKVMLSRFLEENPELNEDNALNLIDDISLVPDTPNFDKSSVDFLEINTKNYEFFLIAYLEGDLSKDEMSSVDNFLKENPKLNTKFSQFNKSKLPIENVEFPEKEKLIFGKTPLIPLPIQRWMMVFAAASIVFLIYLNIPFKNPDSRYELVEIRDIEIKIIENELINGSSFNNAQLDRSIVNNQGEDVLVKQLVNNNFDQNLENRTQKLASTTAQNPEKNEQLANDKRKNQRNSNFEGVSKLEPLRIARIATSVSYFEETKVEEPVVNSKMNENKPLSIKEITAEYLQKKNVLTDDRRPDILGIVNNTFSNVNSNKKPIIEIEESTQTKRTIFQVGRFKIERNKKK